ncbi:TerB family tellurite resistance protein [Robertkochia aurantiaca]|uniref:TerB family tellurite resistance protein n=1 Tax=Robertkochia aurantiaca TaxID=2873700 RepID=UPI001CCF0ED3|nr:TerB family tellurite resistance protein [Robertkochia sp. 3YJGBD-33]
MNHKKERLSLLSEMIHLVRSDHDINPREYEFIYRVAKRLGVKKEEFDHLFRQPNTPFIPPREESGRILQLHRLVLLMNIDDEIHPNEIVTLKEFGVRMGLSPYAIDRVLEVMDDFPNKVVPPDVLIDIFKAYYN